MTGMNFQTRSKQYHRFMHCGGPDGEAAAAMRYLSQRYAAPFKECKGILTDIGTEEYGITSVQ